MMANRFWTRRNAPIWFPGLMFVRDFLAWQYIFPSNLALRNKLFSEESFSCCLVPLLPEGSFRCVLTSRSP